MYTFQGTSVIPDRVGIVSGGDVWNDGTTTNSAPRGVTVDSNNIVYWTDLASSPTVHSIYRQGANPGERIQIATSGGLLGSIRYNAFDSSLLVIEATANTIAQYSLSGTRIGNFHVGGVNANTYFGSDDTYLYFSNNTDIVRRRLDNTGATETVVSGTGNQVRGMAVLNDRLFWATDGTSNDLFRSRSIVDPLDPIIVSPTGLVATARDMTTDGSLLFYVEGNGADRGVYSLNSDFTGRTRLNDLSAGTPFSIAITAIPEPSSIALLSLISTAGLVRFRKRMTDRRKS